MTAPRPILFAIEALTFGGAERLVVELASRMDRARWQPHVLCLTKEGPLAAEVIDAPVHVLGKRRGIDPALPGKIRALVETIRPAVINPHLWTANTWMRWSLDAERWPIVVTEHNRDNWKHLHHRLIDRHLARRCRRLIAVSDDAAAFYRDDVGVPADLVITIPNGIAIDTCASGTRWRVRSEFGIPDEAPLVGMVGRFVPQKNLPLLLEAFARVRKECANACLLLAGDGPEMPALQARARQDDLAGSVHFAGPRRDVPDVLAALDIFVLSSHREGHPLAAMEAQAAGVPVVLTDVGGCRNALAMHHGEPGGLLAPPSDPPGLANAILSLAKDPDRRVRMAEAARQGARAQFDISVMIERYEAEFLRAIGETTCREPCAGNAERH